MGEQLKQSKNTRWKCIVRETIYRIHPERWERKIWSRCLHPIIRDVFHAFFHFLTASSLQVGHFKKNNNAVMREVLFYRGLPHFLLPNWQNDSKSGNRTFSRFCTCMCKSVSELAVRHNSPPEGLQPPSILCYVHPNCRNSSCYLIIDTILHGALTKKCS